MNNQCIWDHFQSAGIDSCRNSALHLRFLAAKLRAGQRVLNAAIEAGLLEALAMEGGVDVHALNPSSAALDGSGSARELSLPARNQPRSMPS